PGAIAANSGERRDGCPAHRGGRIPQRRLEYRRGPARGEVRQPVHGFGARQVVIRMRRGVTERREGLWIAGARAQRSYHPRAIPEIGIGAELGGEPARGLREVELLENRVAVVEDDHRGWAREPRDPDGLLARVELDVLDDVTARRPYPDRDRHAEDGGRGIAQSGAVRRGGVHLRLLDGQRERARRGI